MVSYHITILIALVACSTAVKLPKTWKTCKRNDPNLNACLKKAIEETAYEDLMKGVPSLGILPLSPLHFTRLELGQKDSKSPVAINLVFKDFDLKGFKSAKIESLDFDWNKGRIDAKFEAPDNIELYGNYEVDGKVLLLPLVGSGKCNFTLEKATMELIQEGSFVTKDGKKYFHCDKAKINLEAKRVYMFLGNLFNGDKALGDNMNKILNDNWKEVYGGFQDTLEKGFAEAFREISNRVFDKVPFDEIAPPS